MNNFPPTPAARLSGKTKMTLLPFIVIFIVFFVGVRIMIGISNHGKIRKHFAETNCEVLSVKWIPFPDDWFYQKQPVYQVCYRDAMGARHEIECMTPMESGVNYVKMAKRRVEPKAMDAFMPSSPPENSKTSESEPASQSNSRGLDMQKLVEENRRLREENVRLLQELENRRGRH